MKKIAILALAACSLATFAQTNPAAPTPPPAPVPAPMPAPAPVPVPVPMPTPGDNGQQPMPVPPPPMPASGTNPAEAPKTEVETKITFSETSHAFGKVVEGEIARYEFKFTNDGDKDLKLTAVNPSCGCTTPQWPREPIAKGKTGVIIVEYNSQGRPGSFTKYITVTSNGSENPITLTISGEVIAEPAQPKSPVIIGH